MGKKKTVTEELEDEPGEEMEEEQEEERGHKQEEEHGEEEEVAAPSARVNMTNMD